VQESSESESEYEVDGERPEKREKRQKWMVLKEMTSEETEGYLKEEDMWMFRFSTASRRGVRKYFRCKRKQIDGTECKMELKLLYEMDSDTVIAYLSDVEHNHIFVSPIEYGVDSDTQTASFSKLGPLTSDIQLNNSSGKNSAYDRLGFDLGDLEQWIHNHTDIPDDIHEVFVVSYHIYQDYTPSFRFALSTRKLLEVVRFSDVLHVDETYKLTWRGIPITIIGTTNVNNKFHPVCFAVVTDCSKPDFQVIFRGLKERIQEIFDHNLTPEVLVCSASMSASGALKSVFKTGSTIRVCWNSARKVIRERVETLVSKTAQENIIKDIDALHNAPSPKVFRTAVTAFLVKWFQEATFYKYIYHECLKKSPKWYLGAIRSCPSTNSALESLHLSIKDEDKFQERLPLSEFWGVATDYVKQWSLTAFLEQRKIDPQLWEEAKDWIGKDSKVKMISTNTTSEVYVIYKNENAEYRPWKTFDEYKQQIEDFHKTFLPLEWGKGTCDCSQYFEKYTCKHILGLAIRMELATPPMAEDS
jgi:hypothetical protein